MQFPPGRFTGTWSEVDCITPANQYYPLELDGSQTMVAGKASGTFDFQGYGDAQGFQLWPGGDSLSGDAIQPLLGGPWPPPAATAHILGYMPRRATAELFVLKDASAYVFFPQSEFPAIGACGDV